jgi:hypothetical protein
MPNVGQLVGREILHKLSMFENMPRAPARGGTPKTCSEGRATVERTHDWFRLKAERSFSKTPLALLEIPQRSQKIDSSKGWPIHVREVEFAENALP